MTKKGLPPVTVLEILNPSTGAVSRARLLRLPKAAEGEGARPSDGQIAQDEPERMIRAHFIIAISDDEHRVDSIDSATEKLQQVERASSAQ